MVDDAAAGFLAMVARAFIWVFWTFGEFIHDASMWSGEVFLYKILCINKQLHPAIVWLTGFALISVLIVLVVCFAGPLMQAETVLPKSV